MLDPKVPAFYLNRGDFHRATQPPRLAHALADYQRANELQRNDAQTLFRISLIHGAFGMQLFNKRDYFSAESEYTLAIQHCASVPHFFVNRGNCFFYTQNYTLALADFRAALQLEPENAEARAKVEALSGSFPDTASTAAVSATVSRDAASHHSVWLAACNFGDCRVPVDAAAVEADRQELLSLRQRERTAAASVHALFEQRPLLPPPSRLLQPPTVSKSALSMLPAHSVPLAAVSASTSANAFIAPVHTTRHVSDRFGHTPDVVLQPTSLVASRPARVT